MATLRANGVLIAMFTKEGVTDRLFQTGKILRRRPSGGYKVRSTMKAGKTYGDIVAGRRAAGWTVSVMVPEEQLGLERVPMRRGTGFQWGMQATPLRMAAATRRKIGG